MEKLANVELTERGVKVVETIKLWFEFTILILLMGIAGGIECGTIPFP